MGLDLKKLEAKLDNALEKETTKSLNDWLDGKRKAETVNRKPYDTSKRPQYERKFSLWSRLKIWWFWRNIKLPMVRRAEVTTDIHKIIQTHPMDKPSGLIFYLDFGYKNVVYLDKGIDKTAENIVKGII